MTRRKLRESLVCHGRRSTPDMIVSVHSGAAREHRVNAKSMSSRREKRVEKSEWTYPGDLVPSEAFVGPTAGKIGKGLRASDGSLEFATFASGRGILPDRCAGERERPRSKLIRERTGGVKTSQETFCVL